MKPLCLILALSALYNGYSNVSVKKKLDKEQALQLAVSISNKKCQKVFGVAPFDSSSYEIEYRNGYWLWGALDVSGINGYSAISKFDLYGNKDTVHVYFSIDYQDSEYRKED